MHKCKYCGKGITIGYICSNCSTIKNKWKKLIIQANRVTNINYGDPVDEIYYYGTEEERREGCRELVDICKKIKGD